MTGTAARAVQAQTCPTEMRLTMLSLSTGGATVLPGSSTLFRT